MSFFGNKSLSKFNQGGGNRGGQGREDYGHRRGGWNQNNNQRQPVKRNVECRYFAAGYCASGDQCEYLHIEKQDQSSLGRSNFKTGRREQVDYLSSASHYSHNSNSKPQFGSSKVFQSQPSRASNVNRNSTRNETAQYGYSSSVSHSSKPAFGTSKSFPSQQNQMQPISGASNFHHYKDQTSSQIFNQQSQYVSPFSQPQVQHSSSSLGFPSRPINENQYNEMDICEPKTSFTASNGTHMSNIFEQKSSSTIETHSIRQEQQLHQNLIVNEQPSQPVVYEEDEFIYSEEDIKAFMANEFQPGKIPEVPPPRKYCF